MELTETQFYVNSILINIDNMEHFIHVYSYLHEKVIHPYGN